MTCRTYYNSFRRLSVHCLTILSRESRRLPRSMARLSACALASCVNCYGTEHEPCFAAGLKNVSFMHHVPSSNTLLRKFVGTFAGVINGASHHHILLSLYPVSFDLFHPAKAFCHGSPITDAISYLHESTFLWSTLSFDNIQSFGFCLLQQ